MKACILDRYGGGASLRVGEMPDPELREDDVLVQVHAAGVNLLDSKIRRRRLSPAVPGEEFGRVLPGSFVRNPL